jgi:hypothetical protein
MARWWEGGRIYSSFTLMLKLEVQPLTNKSDVNSVIGGQFDYKGFSCGAGQSK